ncbi:MAG TPA: hypothetical protein VF424_12935, partial [Vicinamibacterales bacterium]
IRNANIQGLRSGVHAPIKAGDVRDIYGSQPGTLVIENSTLRNFWNIYTSTPYGVTGGGSMIPPRLVIARNVQFSNVAGSSPSAGPAHVFRDFTPTAGPNQNILVSDRVVVESFNGNPGDNFEVFALHQAASFVIPATGLTTHLAGLSNATAWVTNGVAISGAVAPCSTTRAGIVGYVCPAGALPSLPSVLFPSPGLGPGTCTIPDPFVVLGGGTCVNGNWYPPGMGPAPGPTTPIPNTGAPCGMPDPFISLGGGTCSNGNWYPPGMVVPPPADSPAPAPMPPPSGCSIPDPFVSLGGGTCVNGNWLPPGMFLGQIRIRF